MAEPKKAAGGKLFHVLAGESPFMYDVDRRNALNLHADEWKDRPWTEEEIEAATGVEKPAAAGGAEAEAEPEQPEPEADDKPKRGRSRK
jgi:hypothetical protein